MATRKVDNVHGPRQEDKHLVDSPPSSVRRMSRTRSTKGLTAEEAVPVVDALRRLLKTCGTQTELARRLGVSKQAVQRVLSGDGRPGVLFARKVAEALGISFEELVGGEPYHERAPEVRLSSLSGWDEAEAEARRRYGYLPDEAWSAVRNLRTDAPPRRLTPEWIGQIAAAWAQGLEPGEPSSPGSRPSVVKRNHSSGHHPKQELAPNSLYR